MEKMKNDLGEKDWVWMDVGLHTSHTTPLLKSNFQPHEPCEKVSSDFSSRSLSFSPRGKTFLIHI